MNRFTSSIHDYFFSPSPPRDLGFCRVTFYLWLFLFYLPLVDTYGSQNVSDLADMGNVFWQPIFPFSFLGISVLPHPWADLLVLTWKISLFLSCLGLFTRASMWCAFLLGTYVIGLPLNFGTMTHTGGVVAIGLGIMALSRAGDAGSIDAWWRRRAGLPPAQASGEYRWPIRFVWVLLATVYFCSGFSKWQSSGLGYLSPHVMAGFLRERSVDWYTEPLTDWGYRLADIRLFCTAASAWTLVGETGFWLALVSRRARMVLVPGMFLTHVGIAALLGPQFFQWLALYVFFVPWGHLVSPMVAGPKELYVPADRTALELTSFRSCWVLLGMNVVGRRSGGWPIVTWPMYSDRRTPIPSLMKSTVELRIIDPAGWSRRLVHTALGRLWNEERHRTGLR